MANRKDAQAILVVGALSLVVAGAGLYLGFHSKRHQQYAPPVPTTPWRLSMALTSCSRQPMQTRARR